MNILVIAKDFKPKSGGIAEYTHQLAKNLNEMDFNIIVLTNKIKSSEDFDISEEYEVLRHDLIKKNRLKFIIKIFRILKDLILKYNIDLIINNDLSMSHYSLPITKLFDKKTCVITHGIAVNVKHDFIRKCKAKFSVKTADLVICNSTFTQRIVQSLGVKKEKTVVINPGFSQSSILKPSKKEIEELKDKYDLKNKKIIFSVSRLIERKGFDKVVESLKIVSNEFKNFKYVISGTGPIESNIKNKVRKLKLNDKVIFTGYISEKEKHTFFEMADIFIMPSRELENGDVEGFGIVFLEANAHGTPVIGGNSGGVPDAVENGVNGLLVEPENEKEIADAILRLLNNESLARKLGDRGKKRVKNKFEWRFILKELERKLKY